MKVFYGFESLPHFSHPAVTVGSFDGVHLGHRALIQRLVEEARAANGESVVVTFDPHPRIALGRGEGLRLLTSTDEKRRLLEELGVDALIVVRFDAAFGALSGREFVDRCLLGAIGAETIVAGYNHRFGHDKQGSYDYLDSHGFGLRIIEVSECDVDAEKVSSTVIRQLVGEGKMARAARLLAHPYLVIGRAQRNRIRVEDPLKLLPPPGEYDAHINGKPARLTVDAAQELITRDILPEGRVVITF